jgi:hypothetical protein
VGSGGLHISLQLVDVVDVIKQLMFVVCAFAILSVHLDTYDLNVLNPKL